MLGTKLVLFLSMTGFFFVYKVAGNGEVVVKEDIYYITTVSDETGSKAQHFLRALLSSKKMSDAIADVYTGWPSSQWEIKRKEGGKLYSLTPKANENNTVTFWGGQTKDASSGYAFKLIRKGQFLIERQNPQAKNFYLKNNGMKRMVTLDQTSFSNKTKKMSPYLWKLTPVTRVRSTTVSSTSVETTAAESTTETA